MKYVQIFFYRWQERITDVRSTSPACGRKRRVTETNKSRLSGAISDRRQEFWDLTCTGSWVCFLRWRPLGRLRRYWWAAGERKHGELNKVTVSSTSSRGLFWWRVKFTFDTRPSGVQNYSYFLKPCSHSCFISSDFTVIYIQEMVRQFVTLGSDECN